MIFATSNNCDRAWDPNTWCHGHITIPPSIQPGTYQLIWWWKYDRNPSGEEYSTCFEIVVGGNGGDILPREIEVKAQGQEPVQAPHATSSSASEPVTAPVPDSNSTPQALQLAYMTSDSEASKSGEAVHVDSEVSKEESLGGLTARPDEPLSVVPNASIQDDSKQGRRKTNGYLDDDTGALAGDAINDDEGEDTTPLPVASPSQLINSTLVEQLQTNSSTSYGSGGDTLGHPAPGGSGSDSSGSPPIRPDSPAEGSGSRDRTLAGLLPLDSGASERRWGPTREANNRDANMSRTANTAQNYTHSTGSGSIAMPRQTHLGVDPEDELHWRYLSTTDAYTSEYSSAASDGDLGPEEPQAAIAIDAALGPQDTHLQQQRGLVTRPLLVPSHCSSAVHQAASASSPVVSGLLSSSHGEADDSTDTIKSMRARALDRINGRKVSAPNMSSSYSTSSISPNSKRGTVTAATPAHQDLAHSPSRSTTGQDTTPGQGHGLVSGSKPKRRSFGHTTDRALGPRTSARTSYPEAHHTIPSTAPIHARKRTSGSFKSQQVLSTSEDEPETAHSNAHDRARYVNDESSIMLSELKALKTRVQELEMERMNRSLSGLSVQSSFIAPSNNPGRPVLEGPSLPNYTEKLHQITHRHRGSAASVESSSTLGSPTQSQSLASITRAKSTAALRGSGSSAGINGRAESSVDIVGLSRSIPTPVAQQSSIQHVALLQEALKTFEKVMAVGGTSRSSSVQAMNKVVLNTVSINQTLRTLIKADVALVDSPSMNALQRASNEQIRSLTESLLALASMHSSSDMGSHMNSPGTLKTYSGQQSSLGMIGNELRGRAGLDAYSTRPLSSLASPQLESGSVTPNAMSSSGYLTRTDSIASSTATRVAGRHAGYASDLSHDRQMSYGGTGATGYPHSATASSRESSPPQEVARELFLRRQMQVPALKSTNCLVESPRSLQSPQLQEPHSAAASVETGLEEDAAAHLARRQASVRNIMARYSHRKSHTPTQERFDHEQGSIAGRLERHGHGQEYARDRLSKHVNDSNSLSSDIRQSQPELQRPPELQQRQQLQQAQRELHRPVQGLLEDPLATSANFSSADQPTRMVSGHRRPLSQQEQRSYSDLRHAGASYSRSAGIVQKSGRYAHDKVFSEDESSTSGWGTTSLMGTLPTKSATMTTFAERLQGFRGRHQEQRQSLQQQLQQPFGLDERLSQGYDLGQQQELHSQHQHQHQPHERYAYAEPTDSDMGDDAPVPHFAQRRAQPPRTPTQHQHQQQHQQQQQPLPAIDPSYQKYPTQRPSSQRHHDMQMTTPSMPSPNSSPSSSSRLDAPSLVSSVGHPGGLVSGAGSGMGMEGRLHVSPRGVSSGAAKFQRQS
ncbi:hypothetical protein EC968_009284 [Mortierella alpina]|nr:hypothetical protein EC968_009284 [Mortierella alpina]